MPELVTDSQTLLPEYHAVLRLAQETYGNRVAPLQFLVGDWSGAVLYLFSVSSRAIGKSPPGFARNHVAQFFYSHIEHEGAIAIFYRIAGQSLTLKPAIAFVSDV